MRARWVSLIVLILTVLLTCVFALSFLMKREAKDAFDKYDMSANCREMHNIYTNEQQAELSVDIWYDYYMRGGMAVKGK